MEFFGDMLGEDSRERVSVGHSETQPGTGRGIKAASRDRKHRDKDGDRDQEPERRSKEAGGVRGLSFLKQRTVLFGHGQPLEAGGSQLGRDRAPSPLPDASCNLKFLLLLFPIIHWVSPIYAKIYSRALRSLKRQS